jgi:hypothetical protein
MKSTIRRRPSGPRLVWSRWWMPSCTVSIEAWMSVVPVIGEIMLRRM